MIARARAQSIGGKKNRHNRTHTNGAGRGIRRTNAARTGGFVSLSETATTNSSSKLHHPMAERGFLSFNISALDFKGYIHTISRHFRKAPQTVFVRLGVRFGAKPGGYQTLSPSRTEGCYPEGEWRKNPQIPDRPGGHLFLLISQATGRDSDHQANLGR